MHHWMYWMLHRFFYRMFWRIQVPRNQSMSWKYLKYAHLDVVIDVFLVFVLLKFFIERSDTCIMECIGCSTVYFMKCSYKSIQPILHLNEHMIELIALIREMTGLLVTDVWIRYMHHGMYWMLHCFFYGFSWRITVKSYLFGYCARSGTRLVWDFLYKSLWSVSSDTVLDRAPYL